MRNKTILLLLALATILLAACNKDERVDDDDVVESPVIANNLSNQKVTAFAEDSQGHVWIGTFRGLNKYDVHEYHQYFCTDDSTGLPDNQINDVMRDSKERLWIATVNGLCLYTDQDNFKNIAQDYPNRNGYQVLETSTGRILLSTRFQLAEYDEKTQSLTIKIHNFNHERGFLHKCFIDKNDNLWTVNNATINRYNLTTFEKEKTIALPFSATYSYMHNDGTLWISGNGQIVLYDTRRGEFLPLPKSIAGNPLLANENIDYIHPYGENSLIICTRQHGLFVHNFIDDTTVHQGEKGFPFNAPNFKVSKMFTDSQHNVWMGSEDQGFAVVYHYKERFNTDNYLSQHFQNKSVKSLAVDSKQNIWMATLNDGVQVYDAVSHTVNKISQSIFGGNKGESVAISFILVDSHDNIWMASTNSNRVYSCRYNDGQLTIGKSYNIPLPMSIAEDENGRILVGTLGIMLYTKRADQEEFSTMKAFKNNPAFITRMMDIGDNRLLISSFMQPLTILNTKNYSLTDVPLDSAQWRNCIRRSVFIPTDMKRDSHGDVWIGTVSNGLIKYSPYDGKVEPILGSPCRDISSIEEDRQGNIWVSTMYGLGKYDRTIGKFINYYEADGIGGNQFYDRSSCRLPDGTLIFGGTHGLTIFNPIDVVNKRKVPLLFEDLKIHNALVSPGEEQAIDKHLSYKPDINLDYDQNGFSISFAALDYCEHERVHYYYKMEGFDKYWIDAHNNREAYYANLPSGTYTFRVKVTNNDKSIAETESSIKVIVNPAPWFSWWAWLCYMALVGMIAWIIVRSWLNERREKEIARKEKEEKEQERRINKMNMNFFANVSHEFRTPLTMISGPVAQLCESKNITGDDNHLLRIVQRSVTRMLRLVNQMLDFNKLENDTLKLKVKRTDIIAQLRNFADVFGVNANEKGITLKTYGVEDTYITWLDIDKIDKIVGNLLSNAMKFTPSGGTVELTFDADEDFLRVTVADTGCGIPNDQLDKIFERYYQLNNQPTGTYNWGTGIGLYYARSLARLHHGSLTAANRPNGGAIFTLTLPTNDSAYLEHERDNEKADQSSLYPIQQEEDFVQPETSEQADEKQTILIVDDDTEVAHYLKVLFSPIYRVVCRFDADSAFEAMYESAPDIVLSDVVMPGKDGYELCRQIKEDLQLCHIPVILVTAKNAIDDQVEGLNTGADAYVTKPFDPIYLKALINSQLKNREKVKSILSQSTHTDKLADNALSPHDNAFMTELYSQLESDLANSEIDTTRIATLMGMSRTKFYYKVKALTGETPMAFFKAYKLNRAAELLKEGKLTVSEIAYMTGFNTPSHFSTSFKHQFGVVPSEYGKK